MPSEFNDPIARAEEAPEETLASLWRQGLPVDVGEFLARLPDLDPVDLVQVLLVDQRERWQLGERVPAEAYLRRFPAVEALPEATVELVYGEFLLREDQGDRPGLDEFLWRFPDHANRLRQQVELHRALEGPAPSPPPSSAGSTAPMQTRVDVADAPVVPGYEVLGEQGRGSMGVVYKARQLGLNRLVALKMILAGRHAGPQELARFRLEAEALARLRHPGIVGIHEVGEVEGRPYFSLEFVEGGSLAEQLAGTPRSPQPAAVLVATLARSIHEAHEAGIVHRDLKPANILLAADGSPLITDFGLAKLLDQGGSGHTHSGVIVGTPSYMAPEQAGGSSQRIGPHTDVYALGAILYEMLTGRPPFKSETAMDTLLQVATEEPVPPSRLQKRVPRDLETICLKCLEKDPARRYARGIDLADDLDRFLRGEPVHARATGRAERLWRWYRRNRLVANLRAAVALLLLTLAGAGVLTGYRERQAAQVERDRRGKALLATEKARREEDEAHRRLVQMYVATGVRHMEDGEGLAALPWLAAALKEERDPARREMAGYRLAAILRQSPRLVSFLDHGGEGVRHAQFSPDGRLALTLGTHSARLWAFPGGKPLAVLKHPREALNHAAFSPDGRWVVTCGNDRSARLWDVASGKQLRVLDPDERVKYAAFDRTGKPLTPPLKHAGIVDHAAFSSDGRFLLTASRDGSAWGWDLSAGGPESVLGLLGDFSRVALSPEAWLVADVQPGRGVRVRHLTSGKEVCPLLPHRDLIHEVQFSRAGSRLASACGDGLARVWNLADGKEVQSVRHGSAVLCVAFHPDGSRLLTGGADSKVRQWDLASGKEVTAPLSLGAAPHLVGWSRDGRLVLTASKDSRARVWEAATGRAIGLPLAHTGGLSSFSFSPDSRRILTTGHDLHALVRDAETGRQLLPALKHTGFVRCGAFSPDGLRIATGGSDRAVRLWDASTGLQLSAPLRHSYQSEVVCFSPDGRRLAALCRDGTLRTWNVAGDHRPAEDWTALARLLTGHRLLDNDALHALGRAELLALWKDLQNRYPADLGPR